MFTMQLRLARNWKVLENKFFKTEMQNWEILDFAFFIL